MMASLLGFVALFLLAFAGVPLAFAMLLVGTGGFALLRGGFEPAFSMVAQQVMDASANDGMSVLPMFILMGLFVHKADLSEELYKAANAWLGHLRGGLAHATVAACAVFAAISGSSIATAATMSKVAIPPMRRLGYNDALSCGSVASAGVLGVLIPPSVPLVIYGLLTNTDIRQLFIATIIPGILLALLFIVAVVAVVAMRPAWGPTGERQGWLERFKSLRNVWMVLLLFACIMGGLYSGVFTATESAGVGATGALLIGVLRRKITWRGLLECLIETATTTAMIFTIMFGAFVFANFITLSGLTGSLIELLQQQGTGTLGVLLTIVAIYLVLGALMESLSLMILTAPIFHAIAVSIGIHPIWFGVFIVMLIEIGMLTPPVGMNVFTVKTMNPDVPIRVIFAGSTPFVIANVIAVALMIAFPAIALFPLRWL
ncbi:TRAP transporter large permease [Eoetvoesiella caeni]